MQVFVLDSGVAPAVEVVRLFSCSHCPKNGFNNSRTKTDVGRWRGCTDEFGDILVGNPVERVEDQRFLTGRGRFVANLAAEGLFHAAVRRSEFAHARIVRIDAAAARALPGVAAGDHRRRDRRKCSLHPAAPARRAGRRIYRQPVIATGKLRYVGEPVALVVADNPATAEDALELITLEVEELPVVADRTVAAQDRSLLFEPSGTNRATVFRARMGDAAAAFANAEYTRRERFSVQRHTALPLEPRGLLAEWDLENGRLTVHGAAKVTFFNRRTLAHMLGLAETAVDLIEVDVGGGFGARGEFYPEDFLNPVRRAPRRRPRAMDRGSPRTPVGDEPRARNVCRCGDRMQTRRHGGRGARGTSMLISERTPAPTVSQRRGTSFSLSRSILFPTSRLTQRCW